MATAPELYGYLISFSWPMVCIMWIMRPVRFQESTIRETSLVSHNNMTSGMRDLEQRLLLTGPPEDISDAYVTRVLPPETSARAPPSSTAGSDRISVPLSDSYPRRSWKDARRKITDPEVGSPEPPEDGIHMAHLGDSRRNR